MTEIETIEKAITEATAKCPVTSTLLIHLVYFDTGKSITARRVRSIVAELREKKKLPILATKRKPRGYYLCQSAEEFEAYSVEIRAHALRELTTISRIKADYFGQPQAELNFV